MFAKVFIAIALTTIFVSCNSQIDVDLEKASTYTINFDGNTTYGVLDSPWRPSGANWEIELTLVWDSSKGANTYPIATGSSATSIYIDSSGLPLLKFEGQYISANVSRLISGVESNVKFSVSAVEVKHYMNDILEGTIPTTKTLLNDWEVIGAHSAHNLNYKGKIRKVKLTDLDLLSNSREFIFTYDVRNIETLTEELIRAQTGIDFVLYSQEKMIKY